MTLLFQVNAMDLESYSGALQLSLGCKGEGEVRTPCISRYASGEQTPSPHVFARAGSNPPSLWERELLKKPS